MTFREIDPDLISKEAAAAILGFSVRKLEYETITGRLPAPFRFGPRCVLYSRREIEAFEAKRKEAAEARAATARAKADRIAASDAVRKAARQKVSA